MTFKPSRWKSKKEGIYVHMWLIHFAVQQKLTQQCKVTIRQLENKTKQNETPSRHLRELANPRTYLSPRAYFTDKELEVRRSG